MELSEKELRERLYEIAASTGNDNLRKVSRAGSLDEIAEEIVRSRDSGKIITGFFAGFPGKKKIVSSILKYRQIPDEGNEPVKIVVGIIADALHWSGYSEHARDVAKAFAKESLYNIALSSNGNYRRIAMESLGDLAYETRDPDGVGTAASAINQDVVLGIADHYRREDMEVFIKGLIKIAYRTRFRGASETVRRVAEIVCEYAGKDLEFAMGYLEDIADDIRDESHDVAARHAKEYLARIKRTELDSE